jgi:hypothetical protein
LKEEHHIERGGVGHTCEGLGLEDSAAEGHPARKGCASRQQRLITTTTFLWGRDVSDHPVLPLGITVSAFALGGWK